MVNYLSTGAGFLPSTLPARHLKQGNCRIWFPSLLSWCQHLWASYPPLSTKSSFDQAFFDSALTWTFVDFFKRPCCCLWQPVVHWHDLILVKRYLICFWNLWVSEHWFQWPLGALIFLLGLPSPPWILYPKNRYIFMIFSPILPLHLSPIFRILLPTIFSFHDKRSRGDNSPAPIQLQFPTNPNKQTIIGGRWYIITHWAVYTT